MIMKYIGKCLCCVLAAGALLISCRDDGAIEAPAHADVTLNISDLTRVDVANTQVWVFESASPNNFNHRVAAIQRPAPGRLSMEMPEGTWDMVLLATPDGTGGLEQVMPPAIGQPRAGQKMLEIKPAGNVLAPAPELAMGVIDNQRVDPHTVNEANQSPVDLVRNVAKVRVTISNPKDYNLNAQQRVSLGNIPSTIDWNGKLWPDKDNPAHSATARMEGVFSISDVPGGGGAQTCNWVEFVIPANREESAADISTHLIDLQVNLDFGGKTYNSPVKTIEVAPRANRVLEITLTVGAELHVSSDILPWTNENAGDAEISNPESTLRVSKTSLTMAPLSDNLLATATSTGLNGPVAVRPTVVPGARWLDDTDWNDNWNGNILTLYGNPDSYDGVERISYVDLAVDNFHKRIPVSQEHIGSGAISATPLTIIMSPENTTASVNINTTGGARWRVSRDFLTQYNDATNTGKLANATLTGLDGANNETISLVRKDFPGGFDNGEYGIFADQTLRVHNRETLEVVHIAVHNIYMTSSDIGLEIPAVEASATRLSDAIEVYGGTGRFTISDLPEWIESATCVANTNPATMAQHPWLAQFVVLREPQGEEWQSSTITVTSYDDPDYSIEVCVEPDLIATIPAFSFFVVKYTWASGDVDIAAAFNYNNAPFDGKPVGYGPNMTHLARTDGSWYIFNTVGGYYKTNTQSTPSGVYANTPKYSDATVANALIVWGGDATGGQGETVFFNAPKIDGNNNLPRKLRLEFWAHWYTSGQAGRPVTLTYYAYGEGQMIQNQTNFNYSGGNQNYIYSDTKTVSIDIQTQTAATMANYNNGTKMTLACTIIYDRVMHTARAYWKGGTAPPAPTLAPGSQGVLQQETYSGFEYPDEELKEKK